MEVKIKSEPSPIPRDCNPMDNVGVSDLSADVPNVQIKQEVPDEDSQCADFQDPMSMVSVKVEPEDNVELDQLNDNTSVSETETLVGLTVTGKPLPKISCKLCGKTFFSERTLKTHYRRLHKDNVALDYSCEFCNESFFDLKGVMRHINLMHKGSVKLDRKLKQEPLKEKKIEITNDLVKKYQCDFCDNSFYSCTGLSSHVKAIHGNTSGSKRQLESKAELPDLQVKRDDSKSGKKFPCPEANCEMTFYGSFGLRAHVQTDHKKRMSAKAADAYCEKIGQLNNSRKSSLYCHSLFS